MTEKTPPSTTLSLMDEINAMSKTRSLIRRQNKAVSDSSASVNSTEGKEDSLQLVSSRIIGNFVLIWLDPNININDEDIEYSIMQLQRIVVDLKTFTDADECTDFLTDIVNEKVFMIISGHLGHQILSFIQDVSQLQIIYIFCKHQVKHEEWVKEYKKVKGVFNQIESICNALKQDVRQSEVDMAPISIMSIPATIKLDELDPSFMYSQLLKETIVDMEFDEEAKTKFADYCRTNYAGNTIQISKINTFQHEYEQHSAIWWYTKEPFIYSTLNKALRTEDTTVIIMMGFFLKDLHRDIEKLHQEVPETSKIVVYRGQGMLTGDFEKMKNNKGALLSFNNFLSTSVDQEVSNIFAISSRDDPELTGILFKMEIDPSVSTTPFGSLENMSHHSDDEKEILFSMHAVFRINEIEQTDDRLWQVRLTLTSDDDEQLKHLTDYMRNDSRSQRGWFRLGSLMFQMGKLKKAEKIYKTMLETISVVDDTQILLELAPVYNSLGLIQCALGEYSNALSYYQKTLEIQQKFLPHNHPDIATPNNNIGMTYHSMGEYSNALPYLQKTLEIQQKSLPHNHPDIARTNNNTGMIYQSMGEYSTALPYYQKTLEIQQKSLPHNHPDIAMVNNNIGMTYQSMGEYSNALSYYQRTLEIQQKSLPHDHLDIARTNNNIGMTYWSMGEYSNALSYYQKPLEIWQKFLPHNHPNIATINNNIGTTYQSMGEYSNALSYYQKTLEIWQNSLPHNHPDIATINNNIGTIYQLMGKYPNALSYLQKTLEIQQKSLPHNHPNLATTNNNIGTTYQSMGKYPNALSHFQKTLEIQQRSLPHNHPDIAGTYNNIGMIYQSMREYSTALSYYQETLEIEQKSLSHNHPDMAITYNNIGAVHHQMGDHSAALSDVAKALEIVNKSCTPDTLLLVELYANNAVILYVLNRHQEAIDYAESSVQVARRVFGLNHLKTIAAQNVLDELHRRLW